jgi:zinc transport system substrate-binding protein
MRKRIYPLLLTALALALAGCGSGKDSLAEGKLNVVTTFYPLYYLAKEIGGTKAHVVNLIPAGVEPHDWTPKSKDLITASKAQLFLYNGAGLEGWVDDFLKGAGSGKSLKTVEASKGIGLIAGHSDEQGGDDGHGHAHDGLDVDPHTWVSPKSAIVMARNIHAAFVEADPANRAVYDEHFASLADRLKELDRKYEAGLANLTKRDIVVSHEAFGYLARDYRLNQIAIMGLSPEAEPRAQDLLGISKFVKEHDVKVIFFEELVSDRLAETLAKETGAETMVLNPLEGLTPEQEKAGEDYLSLMERNLQNLRKALQ